MMAVPVYVLTEEEIGGEKIIRGVFSTRDKAKTAFESYIVDLKPKDTDNEFLKDIYSDCLKNLYAEVGEMGGICGHVIYKVEEYNME